MGIQVTDLHLLRDQLVIRRQKLETAVAKTQTANLLQLLEQVDRALERVDRGSYGVCEACAGAVEAERLFADPLTQLCLDCLQPAEQRALEQDLLLAARIQAGLLPKRDFLACGLIVVSHFPAGSAEIAFRQQSGLDARCQQQVLLQGALLSGLQAIQAELGERIGK